jgi:monoamine oxidase
MARTPILTALQRLARDLDLAARLNLSVETVRALRAQVRARALAEGRLDPARRRFLAGTAALGASLAIPGLALMQRAEAKSTSTARVAIVGAGLAGLTAALRLRDYGLPNADGGEVVIYEASPELGPNGEPFAPGGRIKTLGPGYMADGQIVELGGELFDTNHATMWELVGRYDLPTVDLFAAQPEGSEDTYYFDGDYYPRAQAELDFEPLRVALRNALQDAPYPTTWDSFTPEAQVLDWQTVAQWIDANVPGGIASPMGQLLDQAYWIEFAADTDHQSALNLVYLLGFQPTGNAFEVFGESDERWRIDGGNYRLIEAMRDELVGAPNPVTIHYGTQLTGLAQDPNGVTLDLLDVATGTPSVAQCDYVILAIPFAVLKDLNIADAAFDPRKLAAIDGLGAGRSGKLMLQFNNRIWNLPSGPWPGVSNGNSYADTGYQSAWDTSRGQSGQSGILTFYNGGSITDTAYAGVDAVVALAGAGTPQLDQAAGTVADQASVVFPGLKAEWNARAVLTQWHKAENIALSYTYYRPGSYTGPDGAGNVPDWNPALGFVGYEAERQERILFAGEHTNPEWQGWMEGAAFEGKRAADELLRLLGIKKGVGPGLDK